MATITIIPLTVQDLAGYYYFLGLVADLVVVAAAVVLEVEEAVASAVLEEEVLEVVGLGEVGNVIMK